MKEAAGNAGSLTLGDVDVSNVFESPAIHLDKRPLHWNKEAWIG